MARRVTVWFAAMAASLAGAGWAGDCPQWGRTNARNMASPEKPLPQKFSAGTRNEDGRIDLPAGSGVRWVAGLGGFTFGNPTVAGGRVYVGTNDVAWRDPRAAADGGGVLMCLDEKTGKLLWQLRSPRHRKKVHGSGFDDLEVGICSAATIEGDRVYVVTNRGEVLCLDAAGLANGNDGPFTAEGAYMVRRGAKPITPLAGDADILWRFDMIRQLPSAPHDATNSSILIDGDLLYVGTSIGVHRMPDKPTPLPDAPSLIVLNKRTGTLVARDTERIGRRMLHGQWSSPSMGRVGKQSLVFFGGGDGLLYAFDALTPKRPAAATRPATLVKRWWYDCNPSDFRRDKDGKLRDYWDGDVSRNPITPAHVGPSEIIATPAFHKGRIYVAVGRDPEHGQAKGILHCIDPRGRGDRTKTGRVWTYRGIGRTMSTAAIADGLVYIADFAGKVHCLDAATGKLRWTHETGQTVWSSTLVADGKVYLGTEEGTLWIFGAGPVKKLLRKVQFPDPISTTPVAANGTLYVATHRHLYAIGPAPADGKNAL